MTLTGFNVSSPYPVPRQDLVNQLLSLVSGESVVIIRSPPASGKSTLLSLIRSRIHQGYGPYLPVSVEWKKSREGYNNWRPYLDAMKTLYVKENGLDTSAINGPAMFLIDNATESYHDHLWDDCFKNNETGRDRYVIALEYGPANGNFKYGNLPSQAAYIPARRRVELFPFPINPDGLRLQLSKEEIREMVESWLNKQLDLTKSAVPCDDDVYEFIQYETQGHVGMVTNILSFLETGFNEVHLGERANAAWTVKKVYDMMGGQSLQSFMKTMDKERGCWQPQLKEDIRTPLSEHNNELPKYRQHQKLEPHDIIGALKTVANHEEGFQESPGKRSEHYLALEFCHKIGLLHSSETDEFATIYRFPSRLHKRIACFFGLDEPLHAESAS